MKKLLIAFLTFMLVVSSDISNIFALHTSEVYIPSETSSIQPVEDDIIVERIETNDKNELCNLLKKEKNNLKKIHEIIKTYKEMGFDNNALPIQLADKIEDQIKDNLDYYNNCYNNILKRDKEEKRKKERELLKTKYSASYFSYNGVVKWNSWTWTWYSQKVLPGNGLKIPGRHVDKDGYVRDKDNLICLASNDLKKGTVIYTPFGGKGKIYDCGCNSGIIDVYVNW